ECSGNETTKSTKEEAKPQAKTKTQRTVLQRLHHRQRRRHPTSASHSASRAALDFAQTSPLPLPNLHTRGQLRHRTLHLKRERAKNRGGEGWDCCLGRALLRPRVRIRVRVRSRIRIRIRTDLLSTREPRKRLDERGERRGRGAQCERREEGGVARRRAGNADSAEAGACTCTESASSVTRARRRGGRRVGAPPGSPAGAQSRGRRRRARTWRG
ncbi:hypothetical protein B0H11DRAFT_2199388, partial [Mycena galericulata]